MAKDKYDKIDDGAFWREAERAAAAKAKKQQAQKPDKGKGAKAGGK